MLDVLENSNAGRCSKMGKSQVNPSKGTRTFRGVSNFDKVPSTCILDSEFTGTVDSIHSRYTQTTDFSKLSSMLLGN